MHDSHVVLMIPLQTIEECAVRIAHHDTIRELNSYLGLSLDVLQ